MCFSSRHCFLPKEEGHYLRSTSAAVARFETVLVMLTYLLGLLWQGGCLHPLRAAQEAHDARRCRLLLWCLFLFLLLFFWLLSCLGRVILYYAVW